jgi:hypothetical protein
MVRSLISDPQSEGASFAIWTLVISDQPSCHVKIYALALSACKIMQQPTRINDARELLAKTGTRRDVLFYRRASTVIRRSSFCQ